MKRLALGKGLDALLPQIPTVPTLVQLELVQIQPNPLQPRQQFKSEKLKELAASIAESGILQPVVVRQTAKGYQLVVGERRWRAAQQAGLKRIPALIQDVSDEKALGMALVENIQRDELNCLEEANAYQVLINDFDLTQEEVATRVGRSRTAVTNALRLLRLPQPIQQAIMDGHLSMGHARTLIPLPQKEQLALAQQIVRLGLSVRETERRVQQFLSPPSASRVPKDANVLAAERKLEEHWRTRVEIRHRGRGGQILFHFHSEEGLGRLYASLLSRE